MQWCLDNSSEPCQAYRMPCTFPRSVRIPPTAASASPPARCADFRTVICHRTEPAAFWHSHRYARACSMGITKHHSTEIFRQSGCLGGKHTLGRARTISAPISRRTVIVDTLTGVSPTSVRRNASGTFSDTSSLRGFTCLNGLPSCSAALTAFHQCPQALCALLADIREHARRTAQ